MRVWFEVPEGKADLMMQLLRSISFVKKAEVLSPGKAAHIERIKEAVQEVALIKKGLRKAVPIKDVLDDL